MRRDRYDAVRVQLHEAFKKEGDCYGYHRLHIILTAVGKILLQKEVLRHMHEEQLTVYMSKREKHSSSMGEIGA